MQERWINPIAWDLSLVERLRLKGWFNFQVDCEGGAVDERYAQAIAAWGRSGSISPIFRIPAHGGYLFDKVIKFGARRLMLSGGYDLAELEEKAAAIDKGSDPNFSLYVMVEAAHELQAVEYIASIKQVTGIHFGLFDLARDLGISDWRQVEVWEDFLSPAIRQIKNMNKTCGSYCLPQWSTSRFIDQLNVQSYALDEFCKLN